MKWNLMFDQADTKKLLGSPKTATLFIISRYIGAHNDEVDLYVLQPATIVWIEYKKLSQS